jgi:hypothetical protein
MQMDSINSNSFQSSTNSTSQEGMSVSPAWAAPESSEPTFKPTAPKKGMALNKKKATADIFASLGIDDSQPAEAAGQGSTANQVAEPAPLVNPLLDPVKVDIEEKFTAEMQVEGGLNGEVSVNGQFQVTVFDGPKADLVCFKLAPQDQTFKYKVHPNLNKASHGNNILEVRDPQRAFRVNTPAPLVKWNFKSSDDACLPVSLSCWPSTTADGTQIVVELELTDESATLESVFIRFPVQASAKPTVQSASPGEAAFDQSSGQVVWSIPVLGGSETSGTFEFSASADMASLLPYTFEARRRGFTKCPMEITECYHQATKDQISFACEKVATYELTCGV